MSSTEIVDRPSTLSAMASTVTLKNDSQELTSPSSKNLIYNYFTSSKIIKESPQMTSSTIGNLNTTPTASTSSVSNSNTLSSTTTTPSTTTTTSTNNSCSSNTSSNSSSFIQLSNDDTLETTTIPLPTKISNNNNNSSLTDSKNKKLIKKLNKKKFKFKKRNSNSNNNNNRIKETKSNKFILNAFVNGFAQLKLCADKIDYEYIIEIYWSNSMKTFIKRTYDDFVLFHRKLMQIFNSNYKNNNIIKNNNNNNNNNNSNNNNNNNILNNQEKVIPTLPGKKPFWVNHLKLAELREIELNSYVQRLIKLPIQISHSSLILEFFETQSCDPKPILNYNNPSNDYENDNYDNNNNNNNYYYEYECNINSRENNYISDDDINDDNEDDDNDDDDDINQSDDSYECDGNTNQHINNNNNNDCLIKNLYINNNNNNNNNLNIDNSNIDNDNNNINNGGGDDEVGLWWDEDNALNELTFDTMSSSFNNYNSNFIESSNLFTNTQDLDCLENILQNYSFKNDDDNNN